MTTLAQLGTAPLPLPFKPRRGAIETYVRVREQARLQLAGRTQGVPVHELLPIDPDRGLTRLPAPSTGDIFLDLEGDPFARDGGREYLLGRVNIAADGTMTSRASWAFSDAEERVAFETVIDEIVQAWDADPGMHVYHYAAYEPAAFKRLMGRYATREAEIDRMLRAGLFIDLYAIVKHAMRASVERYSIKDLEPFYGFTRTVPLADARTKLRVIERALELGGAEMITADVRSAVEGYNRDDCVSALRLREWLETLRASVEATGTVVSRPVPKDGAPSERVDEQAQRVQTLVLALTANIPLDVSDQNGEQRARWLLAHLLDWHRRENKAPWWESYRLRDLSEEELQDEKAALVGLTPMSRISKTKRGIPTDRYQYPPQDAEIRKEDELHLPDGTDFGIVEAIDRVARTLDIKKRGAQADVDPSAVFAHKVVRSAPIPETYMDSVLHEGIDKGVEL